MAQNKTDMVMTVGNFQKVTGIHITQKHNGKMDGMMSLSTSCLCNPQCKRYSEDPDKICSHCYARTQMSYMTSMQGCFERNSKLLTERILTREEMPVLNAVYFRFESFGDLINEVQCINYFNICKANPSTKFALWTKNPHIVSMVINKGIKKPRNLQIVLSSHYMNKASDPRAFDFVDKVFTVYDKEYIKEHEVEINCGARNCLSCKKCYTKNKTMFINEKLK